MKSDFTSRTSVTKKAFSLLCLALFLFLQTLATAPALHQHLHKDAAKAEHHCAVTLIAQGKFNFSTTTISVVLPSTIVSEIEASSASVPVAVEYRLLPVRGPPSLLV
jgi:hypothetical protein